MSMPEARHGRGVDAALSRCPAAHDEDPRPCDGPADAVQIVDRTGASVAACALHGSVLLASLDHGRVYPLSGPAGSAISVYVRARALPPFDFLTGLGSRSAEAVR